MNSKKLKLSVLHSFLVSVLLACTFCFIGCTKNYNSISTAESQPAITTDKISETEQEVQQIINETEKIEPQGNLKNDEYIETLLSGMTLDEKIFQMMFVTPESITGVGQVIQSGKGTADALKKYPVGGIIYFAQNIQSREQISKMISNSQSFSKIPLLKT